MKNTKTLSSPQFRTIEKEVQTKHYALVTKFIDLQNRWENGEVVTDDLLALLGKITPAKTEVQEYLAPSVLQFSKKVEWHKNYFYSFVSDYENMLKRIQRLLNYTAENIAE